MEMRFYDLLEGKDVTVNSILEADILLEKALPDAIKAPRASPEGGISGWSKFKDKNENGMYHKDYNIDTKT
ncbi:hypothetical protein [Chryseobacterium taeanense]|nr:hypothetical protein [Chryseobacterium taeanense]